MDGLDSFRTLVREEGTRLYRDLPWRRTRDPYAVWVSEVMLQQTQVARVEARWGAWMERFPTVEALALAETSEVLAAWQGLGYNRRALNLKAAAELLVQEHGGAFPQDTKALEALPGVGPATAQGIRSFAFDLPGVYLETNVRTVFLQHLFPDVEGVPDRELVPLVRAACPMGPGPGGCPVGGADRPADDAAAAAAAASVRGAEACGARGAGGADARNVATCRAEAGASGCAATPSPPFAAPQDELDTPRSWYYALLDYGAHLKRTVGNAARRSSGHARQSVFEGSRRQKRAEVVRILLAAARANGATAVGAGGAARGAGGSAHVSGTTHAASSSDADGADCGGAIASVVGTGSADGVAWAAAAADGLTCAQVARELDRLERGAGRDGVDEAFVRDLLGELAREGFCSEEQGRWRIA